MKVNLATKVLATTVSAALLATPALAKKASDLTYINGENAGSAQNQLEREGFKYISSNHNSMGYTYSYWWHGNSDHCVRTEVYRGVVETVADAKDSDCGHSGDDAAAALGVAAGAAILGSLLSHKSHHHDDKAHYDNRADEQQYERGYKDGLHNAAYHNYNRSDAYSHGYQQGVDERNANLSHHHGHGGYHQVAEYKDLNGARAAGAMDTLERRGFRQVDNFTSGNTRYSIQWRESSRQCLQATIADGRIYDIRDIHQHPKCHSSGSSAGSDGKTWYQRLVGAAGDGAETQMGINGFRKVDTFSSGRNGYGTVWYNRSKRQCLQLITVKGRVDSAVDIQSHPKCR